ncbi:hypothetical protein T07_9170 [Trichinella nelsoni]|uniref:Uncharacterized protein n=1 Tax=Trichinella nelsoni TaxID=6336 RepID=A0A0V0SBV6_9BILA|nr:hypothetical protein T07_9170 [Trichinella nelsoni]
MKMDVQEDEVNDYGICVNVSSPFLVAYLSRFSVSLKKVSVVRGVRISTVGDIAELFTVQCLVDTMDCALFKSFDAGALITAEPLKSKENTIRHRPHSRWEHLVKWRFSTGPRANGCMIWAPDSKLIAQYR